MKETENTSEVEKLARVRGELKWMARAKETSASVFLRGSYPAPIQALLEFTDNSVGFRNRDREYPTNVIVALDKDRISVADFGGIGANAEGIKRFALVGPSEEVGISFRGAGAKYAAWFFGEDLEIKAKKQDENLEYFTTIIGFGDSNIEYEGPFYIDPRKSEWDINKGRFEIIIKRLKNPAELPQGSNLRKVLSEVYRPLLSSQRVDFREAVRLENRLVVDQDGQTRFVNDKIVLSVTTARKREQVLPLRMPLLQEYSEDVISVIKTSEREPLWFWAGEMDLRNPDSRNVKAGIRFYFDGRLIMIDYCGFDDKDPRLAGLVGEVHIDHIKDVKSQLSVNKSAGINTDSDQWKRINLAVSKAIKPLVEKLQQKPVQTLEGQPQFLQAAFSEARKFIDACIRDMASEGTVISTEELALLVGETLGQKRPSPPEPRGRQRFHVGGGKPWGKQTPRTPPGLDSDEALSRIRKSYVDGFEIYGLQDLRPVSIITSQEDKDGKKKKLLVLNSSNPTVLSSVSEGRLAMERLIGDELADHMASEYSSDLNGYMGFRNELRYRFARTLTESPTYIVESRKRVSIDEESSKENSGRKKRSK